MNNNLYRWTPISEKPIPSGYTGPYRTLYHAGEGYLYYESFQYNEDSIEWLEQLPEVHGVKTAEQIISDVTGFSIDHLVGDAPNITMSEAMEAMKIYRSQFTQSVPVSEEEKNIYREQGYDSGYVAAKWGYAEFTGGITEPPTKEQFLSSFLPKKPL